MTPSKSKLAHILGFASAMAADAANLLSRPDFSKIGAFMEPRKRRQGNASGRRYMPGGPNANVSPANVRNPTVGLQVALMHEKWVREQFPSRVTKVDAAPASISSIKQNLGCHRSKARKLWTQKNEQDEAEKNNVDTDTVV